MCKIVVSPVFKNVTNKSYKKDLGKSRGMTFIEVLVALFIIVTGILGAVALQATAKKASFDAMQRSVASALAQNIIERMRSNSATLDTLESYDGIYGASDLTVPDTRCMSSTTLCNSTQMVTNDLYEWSLLILGQDATIGGTNTGGLVNAMGCITHNNYEVTVVVSWKGRSQTSDNNKYTDCGTSSSSRRQLAVEAFIF